MNENTPEPVRSFCGTMFAISTALHFLARIATAAEQAAEVLKEQRQDAMRQAIAARQ